MKSLYAVFAIILCVARPCAATVANDKTNDHILKVSIPIEPPSYDWGRNTSNWMLFANIMEGLLTHTHDLQIAPGLADRWSISDDHKTYTFHIRDNAKWSDGKPVTAQHFIDAWERALNPRNRSRYAQLLEYIKGANEYTYSKKSRPDFKSVGVTAKDNQTLIIELEKPVPFFLHILTFWSTFPIRKDLITKTVNYWDMPEDIVVTGPYIVNKVQKRSNEPKKILLVKNEFYWNTVITDKIELIVIPNTLSAIEGYAQGQLDIVTKISIDDAKSYKSKADLVSVPSYVLTFLSFNTRQFPLQIVKIRQAIAQAIDQDQITKALGGGYFKASGLISNLLNDFSEKDESHQPLQLVNRFNPRLAKRTLAESGVLVDDSTKIEIAANRTEENEIIAKQIKSTVESALGIKVVIDLFEYNSFRTTLDLKAYPIYIRQWGADYPDPDSHFSVFLSDSGNNRTGWLNPEYDQLVRSARNETSLEKRKQMYGRAVRLLLQEETAIVPLVYSSHVALVKPGISGFQLRGLGSPHLRTVKK